MDNVDETIKEQFKQLPKKLQDFIRAPNFRKKIKSILEGQPLDQVQCDAFENEVMLVLLRLEDINSFTVNVHHNVQISRERAEKLSRASTQKIFMPVTEMLKYQRALPQNLDEDDTAQDKGGNVKKQKSDYASPDTPQHSNLLEKDMFHKKLIQHVHTRSEEKKINLEEKEIREKPQQTTPPTDPYREPIE